MPPEKMPLRCEVCNKKLGLIPFTCKCEHVFCAAHRLPFDHACPVPATKDALAKSLPKVSAAKVVRF